MATRTLNQIVTEIMEFGQAHAQLRTVKFSKQGELRDGVANIDCPALYFDYFGARKERNVLLLRFTAWISDVMLKEKDNLQEIWNDTTLIACDLLALLDGHDDFSLEEGVEIKNFDDPVAETEGGVSFDFVLRVPFPYDRCAIPGIPIAAGHDFNPDFNSDFDGGADGPEEGGSDFNPDFNPDFATT